MPEMSSLRFFAVNMPGDTQAGDVYLVEEIRDWLGKVGFVKMRMLDAPGSSPLVPADKP